MGFQVRHVPVEIETEVEQFATGEVDLVSDDREVARFRVTGRGGSRTEDGEPQILVMLVIKKIAASQDVPWCDVGLEFEKIADPPELV